MEKFRAEISETEIKKLKTVEKSNEAKCWALLVLLSG